MLCRDYGRQVEAGERLGRGGEAWGEDEGVERDGKGMGRGWWGVWSSRLAALPSRPSTLTSSALFDRKSVVKGKSVDLGGRRLIQKQKRAR